MADSSSNLLIPTSDDGNTSVYARVSARQAGWQYLNMVALRLETGKTFGITIEQYEYVAVILGGVCDIRTSKGNFVDVGRRPDVFTGLPYAVYMPRNTEFEIEALTDDFAMASCWVPTDQDHPLQLITPRDVTMNIHGGGNASHQINTVLPPGFDCHRLTVREIYTPGGNWANYPPHKHDTTVDNAEAPLEELFFFKLDRPHGYVVQRIYSDDDTLDTTLTARHNDIVLIPKGYHTLSAAHGYTAYTLSVTAGASSTLAHTVDPHYKWVEQTWLNVDPRLPIVDLGMEPFDEPNHEAVD